MMELQVNGSNVVPGFAVVRLLLSTPSEGLQQTSFLDLHSEGTVKGLAARGWSKSCLVTKC